MTTRYPVPQLYVYVYDVPKYGYIPRYAPGMYSRQNGVFFRKMYVKVLKLKVIYNFTHVLSAIRYY